MSVDQYAWDSRDTIIFDIPPTDHDKPVALSTMVRTTDNFQYRSLSLLVTQKDSNSITIAKDTIHLTLFTKEGKPMKQGFPFVDTEEKSDIPLLLKGGMKYTIEISHLMKMTQIDGVYDVGVELRELNGETRK